MKANEVAFKSFITQNKTQFVIPVYQRNYDWKESECKQLLEDIIEIGSKDKEDDTHFIGSIVYIHDGVYTTSEVKQLVIIDGQQRLTTLTLLYLALYNFSLNNGMEEQATEINETMLINRFVKDESYKLKLKQTDTNASALAFLMNDNKASNYNEYSRIIENYKVFSNQISETNIDTILKGLDRLIFVEVSLERGKDDPQRIFESLNSTGLALSQADLIRNYILMGLEPDMQDMVFKKYWSVIENNTQINHTQETFVSDFIRDFLTIVNKKISNKGNVYEDFKNKFQTKDPSFYDQTLAQIKAYSFIYSKLLNPENESDTELRYEFEGIRKLEINVSYPFLLQVYADYEKDIISKQQFLSVLRLIQSYTWRRFIIGLPSSSLSKVFMTLYSDVKQGDYLASLEKALIKKRGTHRFPTNDEIETMLIEKDMYNIQPKNKSYFFEQIEHFNNPEKVDLSTDAITVEHIFPQTPSASWKTELNEEDYVFLTQKCNTIANLTLSGNNGALSNKSFAEKKTMNKDLKRQGYLYSNLRLNEYLKSIDRWDAQTYNERANMLIELFKHVWKYPNVNIISKDEEYTVNDAPEPRYKTIEYFNFRNEVIITNEFSKMYTHVIENLFKENPSMFLNTDLKEVVFLSSDQESLRSAYPVSDTYYIETNIDSNGKLNKLKRILQTFELEDELSFKYIESDN